MEFAMCGADIAIYGGSAGSGKSFGLMLEPLRYCTDPKYGAAANDNGGVGFNAVVFRRTTPSIRNPGALWDQTFSIYPELGGSPSVSALEWNWPGAGRVKFAHLEYEKTVFDWHASQITLLCFDELTEFSEKQFFYMLSRNRSQCGVRPYVRATCNPDADSWVAKLIDWWIDDREELDGQPNPNYGFPRKDRSGKVRFFIRSGDDLVWADHPEELTHEKLGLPRFTPDGQEIMLRPMSMTFIAASIFDNKELLKADPEYLGKLLALPTVERERLLKGNWRIRPAPGLYFNRNWVEIIRPEDLPPGLVWKRGWDLAATQPKPGNNDPDATASVLMGKDIHNKMYYIADSSTLMGTPLAVEHHILAKAKGEGGDGPTVEQWFPQDPGQAGVHQIRYLGVLLDGCPVRATPETGDKVVRFSPFSATAQAGRVKVVRGPWNNRYFSALESFPSPAAKDDDIDATSRAFNSFLDGTSGLVEFMQIEAEKLRQTALAASLAHIPTIEAGGVRVWPVDPNINQLFDMRGRLLLMDEDGSFVVAKAHADILMRGNQFRYAKPNGGNGHG